MREMMSVLLPAGNGTIRRTGRSGQAASPLCAAAAPAANRPTKIIASSRIILAFPWAQSSSLCPAFKLARESMDRMIGLVRRHRHVAGYDDWLPPFGVAAPASRVLILRA